MKTAIILHSESGIVFLGDPRVNIDPGRHLFERMTQVMRDTGAGWIYSDSIGHPRINYQTGSIRDNFDFGAVIAVRADAYEKGAETNWSTLYDLRLRVSEKFPIVRIPEPLYSGSAVDTRPTGQKQFDYVDPKNRDYQIEMERVATAHLKRIGSYLEPRFQAVPPPADAFSVRASVVIPVRNREQTILDAVTSALNQKTVFNYNVIVVDNHSTDRTTELLRGVRDSRLVHLIPDRHDLGIGGCWNEALYSEHCGRYAVQLDSDDLYSGEEVLARIVGELEAGPYAMVIASYTMVDFSLQQIPPGLIDHREWTRENGRNNALRINGLGAPRAFDTSVLRRFGFPNVSYGEDYAMALRISRDFDIGRIYDSVYLCRRWEGNTDTALPLETANRYDSYKDWIRTMEIKARQVKA
ncbi:MAG TPA: glycosyltransferase family 2 protein [Terriglobia bacterium]